MGIVKRADMNRSRLIYLAVGIVICVVGFILVFMS
jgi:hypothetical protein